MYRKMGFFRQVSRSFKKFGRTLQKGAQGFGRQVSNVAGTIGHGLGKAQDFVSKLESKVGGIPIVGTGLKLVGQGLGVAHGLADTAQAGGSALSSIASGDVKGASSAGQQALNSLKQTGNLGTQFVGATAPIIGGFM